MAEKLRPLDQTEMGKRVRSRREAVGLSRENLAERLDVSAQFIADIEYGNKGISIKKLYLSLIHISPSKLTIPAVIEESERKAVRELAAGAYKAVGGYGFCRIDFFMEENTHNIYINEINTIPGFTDGSMFPRLWQNRGLEYGEIIERIIDLGYERYYAENNRQTTI